MRKSKHPCVEAALIAVEKMKSRRHPVVEAAVRTFNKRFEQLSNRHCLFSHAIKKSISNNSRLSEEKTSFRQASKENFSDPLPQTTETYQTKMSPVPPQISKIEFLNGDFLRSGKNGECANITDLFSFGRELGRGTSGVVYKCYDTATGLRFACKLISKSDINSPVQINDLKYEIKTLKKLQGHPSVIDLKAVFQDEENIYMVMEYGGGGDLFSRIQHLGFFTEPEAAAVCRTVASVLHFSHKNGVMHRDLKPENILLKSKRNNLDIRVADFGSSTFFDPDERLSQLVGSPLYIAPEVLKKNYGPEADLWSLGVILYVLLSGRPPFHGSTADEILESVQTQEVDLESGRWQTVSKGAKNLVLKLLNRDESKRISAKQVMKDPWICEHVSQAKGKEKKFDLCPSEDPSSRSTGVNGSKNKLKQKSSATFKSSTGSRMDFICMEAIPVAELVHESKTAFLNSVTMGNKSAMHEVSKKCLHGWADYARLPVADLVLDISVIGSKSRKGTKEL